MKIKLLDGVQMNQQHPDSFYIPSDEDKKALKLGDDVKLALTGGELGERMWFTIVKKKRNGKYLGELNSMPIVYTDLEPGDAFEFEAKHIIDIA